jgi:hypothetical protein
MDILHYTLRQRRGEFLRCLLAFLSSASVMLVCICSAMLVYVSLLPTPETVPKSQRFLGLLTLIET